MPHFFFVICGFDYYIFLRQTKRRPAPKLRGQTCRHKSDCPKNLHLRWASDYSLSLLFPQPEQLDVVSTKGHLLPFAYGCFVRGLTFGGFGISPRAAIEHARFKISRVTN